MTTRKRQWVAVPAGVLLSAAIFGGQAGAQTRPTSVEERTVSRGGGAEDRRLGDGPSRPGGWAQTILALAAVIGLIFLARYLLRRVGSSSPALGGGGPIRVLARANLSPKERLLLVRMGGRVLLLGSAPGGLTTLSEVTDPDEVSELLEQVAAGKSPSKRRPTDEGPAADGEDAA